MTIWSWDFSQSVSVVGDALKVTGAVTGTITADPIDLDFPKFGTVSVAKDTETLIKDYTVPASKIYKLVGISVRGDTTPALFKIYIDSTQYMFIEISQNDRSPRFILPQVIQLSAGEKLEVKGYWDNEVASPQVLETFIIGKEEDA